jgi:hypothetical protein
MIFFFIYIKTIVQCKSYILLCHHTIKLDIVGWFDGVNDQY